MDSPSPRLDFAVIAHQDSWQNITGFINGIRPNEQQQLSTEKIKEIFSFIPPRDIFRIKVKSKTGAEVSGVYIETFIDPDKLDSRFIRINIGKVMKAITCAKKMGAGIVTLGGFTSIVLEGNPDSFAGAESKFTTGNTLTAAYIVKGIEQAVTRQSISLQESAVLIIGATGDIGLACTHFLKTKIKKVLLCARNNQRLEKLSQELAKENIPVHYSVALQDLVPEADIIICAASSSGIELAGCKKNVLVCDAGYPKNLEAKFENSTGIKLFHGGMGQVNYGYHFCPDYSKSFYRYPAPNISHGCILEAIVLAFENKLEPYSAGKGNITIDKMDEIYGLSVKHGIDIAPFYNANGLWQRQVFI